MWFQQPDAFTHVQFVWNAAQTSSWSVLSDQIYITKHMKWPDVNSPYIFSCFIKIKLSISLCLTHKRVTQKYRNSTLIYKKKKTVLGSDRNRLILRIFWIGSDLKKWYRCIPREKRVLEKRVQIRGAHKETYKQTQCLWYAFQTMLNLGLISDIKLQYYHYNAIWLLWCLHFIKSLCQTWNSAKIVCYKSYSLRVTKHKKTPIFLLHTHRLHSDIISLLCISAKTLSNYIPGSCWIMYLCLMWSSVLCDVSCLKLMKCLVLDCILSGLGALVMKKKGCVQSDFCWISVLLQKKLTKIQEQDSPLSCHLCAATKPSRLIIMIIIRVISCWISALMWRTMRLKQAGVIFQHYSQFSSHLMSGS